MSETLVSAIVSAYYAADFLQERLENLASQTLQPEIVVVCQDFAPEYRIASDFEYSKKSIAVTPNIPTVYGAWNAGIRFAQGKYITNANCDDRLDPNAIELLADALDKHPAYSVAYCDLSITDGINGPELGTFTWAEGDLDVLLHGCFLGPMPMWRTRLHQKFGYFDESFTSAGDYEFWLRCAAGGEKFFHVRQVLGRYAQRDDSLEHRKPVLSMWETARARARYRKNGG